MSSLAESFPLEQQRVRELLVEYDKLGIVGMFGAAVLRVVLAEADQAAVSGDVVRMLSAYEALMECQ